MLLLWAQLSGLKWARCCHEFQRTTTTVGLYWWAGFVNNLVSAGIWRNSRGDLAVQFFSAHLRASHRQRLPRRNRPTWSPKLRDNPTHFRGSAGKLSVIWLAGSAWPRIPLGAQDRQEEHQMAPG